MRFVLVGLPRTGTTMFLITLNTLKEFDVYGEIMASDFKSFDPHPQKAIEDFRIKTRNNSFGMSGKGKEEFLDIIYLRSERNKHVGFKFLYPHIIKNMELIEGYINCSKKKLTTIHLKRKNPVKRVISQSLNKYHHYGIGNNNVNAEYILKTIEKFKKTDEIIGKWFNRKRYVDMYYEDLTSDTDANEIDFSKMFDYMGIDLNPIVKVPTKKYGPNKLIDRVGNYDELYEYFKKNAPEYLKYVEE